MRASLGTIEDLSDGRFRIRVTAGYGKDGKRIRPSSIVRGSRRDAERELSKLLVRVGKASSRKMTLHAFLDEVWLPSKDVRVKTLEGYTSKINVCIVPYIGGLALQTVKPYVVERWMSDLRRDGKCPQTIKHARSVLKNAMRDAVRWELIDRDPTEGSTCPVVRYVPKVIDATNMAAYVDQFSGHPIEPIVVLMIALGVRRSEACAVDWKDIDFEAGTVGIHRGIHQNGARVWYEPVKSETSDRILGLPQWALGILRPLRGVGPLVPDARGFDGRMPPDKAARLYKEHLSESKLPYVPMRNLRNSFGTYLYASGAELGRIADQLGHSTTEITRKHYVERSHRNVDRTTVALIESIRVGQNGPNDSAEHGQEPTDSMTGTH